MFFFKLPRPRRSIRPDTLLPYTTLCLSADIPVVSLPRGAGKARVIAGEYRGAKGPAKTFTPINVRDLSLKADTDLKLDLPLGHTAMIVVLTRSEEHTSELQSLMRRSYAGFCLKQKINNEQNTGYTL